MVDYLYIFLDEGGDFNFSDTGSKFFTLTAASCKRPFEWEQSLIDLKYDLLQEGSEIEYFHASEDRQEVRNKVFGVLSQNLDSIRIDSVVVEKRKTIPSIRLIEKIYPMMMGYLLKYVMDPRNLSGIDEVLIITDTIPIKKKKKAVEKAIKLNISGYLCGNIRYKILHHPSKSCLSLQMVDYCNWAIFRKWKDGDARSHNLIESAIKSEFDIFQTGTFYYY